MRPIVPVIVASLGSSLAVAAFFDRQTGLAILAGMSGPLIAVTTTWILSEKFYRRSPTVLTQVMLAAFAGKLIFFGMYVTVMLGLLLLRPMPFIASFTSYFIVLYLTEALYLRRLFWAAMRAPR
jgi:hypothetical protein